VPRSWSRAVGDGAVVTDPSRIEIKSLESAPVVCLADIPIIHLSYHAQRYGEIAIGFHRKHVMEKGFMPVFYRFSAQATAGIERVIKPLHDLKTSESLRSQSPHSFGRRERYLWKHRCATETVTTSTSSSRSCRR